MKGRIAPSSLAFALALLGAGAATAQDPLAVAPANHKVTLENERVRTYEFTLKSGAEVPMHSHPEHVVYVLAGGKLESTDAAGAKSERSYAAGETVLAPAGAHSLRNVGKTTVRAVVTELKEAAPSPTLSMTEREAILGTFAKAQRELLDLVASTPDELWAKKPAPDRWSVAEIVEHIATAEPMLFGMSQQALAAPADPNWALAEGKMSPDAFLGMLQNRSKKFQAPEPIQPKGGWSRADALAKFGAARAVTAEFVRRTELPIKKHVGAGPAGSMTVHQMLILIGGHNLRHNAQIRETLEQLQASK
jgi:beta-alanine degradation protein BauB